jgi:hypothetical protein
LRRHYETKRSASQDCDATIGDATSMQINALQVAHECKMGQTSSTVASLKEAVSQ